MSSPVNFANVSLTLQQFNEIASGKYNAGEVRLAGEHALAKINNHVFFTSLNTVSLSHAEVLAIKDALVKALRQAGVDPDEINRVRTELGLAPDGATDVLLTQRSMRPLSRQQIREILDRNAAAINTAQGPDTVRTDAQIHARYSAERRAELAQTRAETNRALNGQRATVASRSISLIQAVIAGNVDFYPDATCQSLLDTARRQREVILERSNGVPSRDPNASLRYRREDSGLDVEFKLGMSEARYVEKLDTLIARLTSARMPSDAVLSARREFGELRDSYARSDWLDAQANAPDGAFKVRTAVVKVLHERGVDDYATLSLANRLSDADARALLTVLLQQPTDLRGAALSGKPAVAAFAHLPGVNVPTAAQTFVPALSPEEARKTALDAEAAKFAAAQETTARFAPDGAATRRALEKGYFRSEISRLRRTAELYQGATGCSADKAVEVALDHTHVAHRIFSYGGRFTVTPEQFKSGIRLLNQFTDWFASANAEIDQKRGYGRQLPPGAGVTATNAHPQVFNPNTIRAFEKFLFEEIAINNSIPLFTDNPEEVFGMEVNPATRFVGRGYTTSAANTLAQIPPERRRVLYDVVDLLSPLGNTEDTAMENSMKDLNCDLISRVMRNYDIIVSMKDSGQFTRAHFLRRIFPDIPNAVNMTNRQLCQYFTDKMYNDVVPNRLGGSFTLIGHILMTMQTAGVQFDDAVDAVIEKRTLPLAPYISDASGTLEELDGTANGGRATLLGDLRRPMMPKFSANGQPALADEHNVFTMAFPDGTVLRSMDGADDAARVANNAIADKVESLCGTIHQKQLAAVYFALSQAGVGPALQVFAPNGINVNEHAPLTYTFAKNADTGSVTIRYSEPEGLPLHFHWETTITLDGIATSTGIVVERHGMPR